MDKAQQLQTKILLIPWAGRLNSKYLLLYLVATQQSQGGSEAIKKWAKALNIGLQAVTIACKDLVALELMQKQTEPAQKGAGRPRIYYQLDAAALDDLLDQPLPAPCENYAVYQPILFAGCEDKAQVIAPELHTGARLLLALLWAFANRDGVVWGRGKARFAKCLGVTESTVKNNLKVLKNNGFIKEQIPGVSAQGIFGRKAGVVVLEPLHQAISPLIKAERWQWLNHKAGIGQNGLTYVVGGSAINTAKQLAEPDNKIQKATQSINSFGQVRPLTNIAKVGKNRIEDFENADGYLYQRESLSQILKRLPAEQIPASADEPGPWQLHKAFIGAGENLERYMVMYVCHIANQLLKKRVVKPQGYYQMQPDVDILNDIKTAIVVDKNQQLSPYKNEGWQWALAAWLYREGYALAVSWVRARAKQVSAEFSQLLASARYTLVPNFSQDQVSVDVLVDEGVG